MVYKKQDLGPGTFGPQYKSGGEMRMKSRYRLLLCLLAVSLAANPVFAEDLAGTLKKVQLMRGHEKGKHINFKEVYGKDHADSFLLLETDRAVAFVMDDNLLAGLIATSKNPKDYEVVGEVLNVEPIAVMVRNVAHCVIFMDHGQIVVDTTKEEFFGNPRSERAQLFLSRILHH
jgi:hypothetical protein